ncbi:YceI family protein [bacterium]|nr:YceI family protein [bacterium]
MSKRLKSSAFSLLALLVIAGLGCRNVQAQNYEISPLSQLQIEGTSSVNSFTCFASEIDGGGTFNRASKGADVAHKTIAMTIPVGTLDCQNRRMNSDLSEALKSDQFPLILFKLTSVKTLGQKRATDIEQEGPIFLIEATGVLTLAGASRTIVFKLEGLTDSDQRMIGKGSLALKMTDFGVTPPTALFGLVKAKDDITIRFNLIAEPSTSS